MPDKQIDGGANRKSYTIRKNIYSVENVKFNNINTVNRRRMQTCGSGIIADAVADADIIINSHSYNNKSNQNNNISNMNSRNINNNICNNIRVF